MAPCPARRALECRTSFIIACGLLFVNTSWREFHISLKQSGIEAVNQRHISLFFLSKEKAVYKLCKAFIGSACDGEDENQQKGERSKNRFCTCLSPFRLTNSKNYFVCLTYFPGTLSSASPPSAEDIMWSMPALGSTTRSLVTERTPGKLAAISPAAAFCSGV